MGWRSKHGKTVLQPAGPVGAHISRRDMYHGGCGRRSTLKKPSSSTTMGEPIIRSATCIVIDLFQRISSDRSRCASAAASGDNPNSPAIRHNVAPSETSRRTDASPVGARSGPSAAIAWHGRAASSKENGRLDGSEYGTPWKEAERACPPKIGAPGWRLYRA